MPVERPTFSESWYRVADLRPRLRSTVQITRQHFRGRTWHIAEDPGSNQYFRMNTAAYRFVALLDGRRTVAEVWRICGEQLGDEAPTQGEAIQLLGQLYTSNLLHADLPPDAETLFNRYHRRVTREVRGYLSNFLFIRIPIFDPDRLLEWSVSIFGKLFTWFGFVLWIGIIATGLYFLSGRFGDLASGAGSVFTPDNLPWLYVGTVIAKVLHEFGHAYACKRFGKVEGTGGEVHVMGIMFLIFTPLPYVDASSAWSFRSKWHRVVVGTAGMMVELAVAAIAAIVWTQTSGAVQAIAYNIIFMAGVSTVLFNANPLLRYDGYYILSDLVEIPNLWQRSREYIHYLVKRYAWAVRNPRNPAHTPGERVWFVTYGICSMLYRIFISIRILLFISEQFFELGMALAVAAFVMWVLVPFGKFLKYLAVSPELARTRFRAVGSTAVVLGAVGYFLGGLPMPNRYRIEGFIEPVNVQFVHAAWDGFVQDYWPAGGLVDPNDRRDPNDPNAHIYLVRMDNPDLDDALDELSAQRRRFRTYKGMALDQWKIAELQPIEKHLNAVARRLKDIGTRKASLLVAPTVRGRWIAPEIENLPGAYLKRGQKIGLVADLDHLLIRAVVQRDLYARLIEEVEVHNDANVRRVDIRMMARPDPEFHGTITRIYESAQEQLPSAALGYRAGGSIITSPDDQKGTKAAENFFEVRIDLDADAPLRELAGQRVVVRISLPEEPLAIQWYRTLMQLIERRLHD